MILTKYKSLDEAQDKLREKGYNHVFSLVNGQILDHEAGEIYPPEKMVLVEFHRFPDQGDENEVSTLYVLETWDGIQGMLVANYRFYPGLQLTGFLNEVKVKPV